MSTRLRKITFVTFYTIKKNAQSIKYSLGRFWFRVFISFYRFIAKWDLNSRLTMFSSI